MRNRPQGDKNRNFHIYKDFEFEIMDNDTRNFFIQHVMFLDEKFKIRITLKMEAFVFGDIF